MVKIIGFRDKILKNEIVINTTSSSKDSWSRKLSPFLLGTNGIKLYDGFNAFNVENAWQYSKVYKEHVDIENNPTEEYFNWAKNGWKEKYAERYPMGKGKKPLYSYWDGEKIGYIEARKKVYIPLYAKEVVKTDSYKTLEKIYKNHQNITLLDFDGYDHKSLNMDFCDVVNDEKRKMGHAFVLAMLLEKKIEVINNEVIFNFDLDKVSNLNENIEKLENISFFDIL